MSQIQPEDPRLEPFTTLIAEVFPVQTESIGLDELERLVSRCISSDQPASTSVPAEHRLNLAQAYEAIQQAVALAANLLTICVTIPIARRTVKELLSAREKAAANPPITHQAVSDKKEEIAQRIIDEANKSK